MATPTGIILENRVTDHLTGEGHPERPERFEAVRQGLEQAGLLDGVERLPLRFATHEELRLVHSDEYLHTVHEDIAMDHETLSTGDTVISDDSEHVAKMVVGGVLDAVDAVMTGSLRQAFCVVRPPGHHATPNRGMGFCIYNNIALAAAHARAAHGLERVLIFDWDVHHGNGTQDAFYDDPHVFFCSMHQYPWYPGTGAASETGAGDGVGATLNLPIRAYTSAADTLRTIEEEFLPAAEKFRPQLVLISAGFDSRKDDPLGSLLLDDEDFAEMTRWMQTLAQNHAEGRLISLLEGGYNLQGLAKAATAHFAALRG